MQPGEFGLQVRLPTIYFLFRCLLLTFRVLTPTSASLRRMRALSDFGHQPLQVDKASRFVNRLIRWIVSFQHFGFSKKGTGIAR